MGKQKNIAVSKSKNGKIELLRFVCALYVALYHFCGTVHYDNTKFQRGHMAVEFFFIVSGYLLAKSLSRYTDTPDEKLDILDTSLKCFVKRISSFYNFFWRL